MEGASGAPAPRIFSPARARAVVLTALRRRRLREREATMLIALTPGPEASWFDRELAQVAGLRDGAEAVEVAAKLSARGWFTILDSADGARHYAWRCDGPMKAAWVKYWERDG